MVYTQMKDLEIIFNVWYVMADDGFIYSLRARPYIRRGTDEEKLNFLQSVAEVDYLIAQPFEVPAKYHTTIQEGSSKQKMPVFPAKLLQNNGGMGSIADFCDEVFKEIGDQLPAQTSLEILEAPLVCVTPLIADDDGNIRPRINGVTRW